MDFRVHLFPLRLLPQVQHAPLDEAEDRRVHADADAEREHDRRRQERPLRDATTRVPHIAGQRVELTTERQAWRPAIE